MKLFDVIRNPSDDPIRKIPEYVKQTHYGVVNVSDSPNIHLRGENQKNINFRGIDL